MLSYFLHPILKLHLLQLYLFISDGRAYLDLHRIVDRLVELGMSEAWGKQQNVLLRTSKQYLTSDYKVITIA